MGSKDT